TVADAVLRQLELAGRGIASLGKFETLGHGELHFSRSADVTWIDPEDPVAGRDAPASHQPEAVARDHRRGCGFQAEPDYGLLALLLPWRDGWGLWSSGRLGRLCLCRSGRPNRGRSCGLRFGGATRQARRQQGNTAPP